MSLMFISLRISPNNPQTIPIYVSDRAKATTDTHVDIVSGSR